MKKKLLSIIATAMSICMVVSFFAGCNQGGDSSSGANLPTTEDEILAYVLAAIETSANYDGAYTYTMNKRTVDNTGMPIGKDAGFLRTTTTKTEGTVDVSAAKKLVKSEVDVFKKNGEEESGGAFACCPHSTDSSRCSHDARNRARSGSRGGNTCAKKAR